MPVDSGLQATMGALALLRLVSDTAALRSCWLIPVPITSIGARYSFRFNTGCPET